MKKLGFTMAELLVTLTIIGVVAAITAPMIDNLMPDKNKTKVLKAYRTISEINEELLNDPSLYAYKSDNSCQGLGCTDAPDDPRYSALTFSPFNSGKTKYGMLFFDKLGLTPNWNNMIASATSKDGIGWRIEPQGSGNNFTGIIVQVFVGKTGETQCLYGDCSRPTLHRFSVDFDGKVTAVDKLTEAYLLNPTKLNDKKKDYAKAESL